MKFFLLLIFILLSILTIIYMHELNNTKKTFKYKNYTIKYDTELDKNEKIITIQNKIIFTKRIKYLLLKMKAGN